MNHPMHPAMSEQGKRPDANIPGTENNPNAPHGSGPGGAPGQQPGYSPPGHAHGDGSAPPAPYYQHFTNMNSQAQAHEVIRNSYQPGYGNLRPPVHDDPEIAQAMLNLGAAPAPGHGHGLEEGQEIGGSGGNKIAMDPNTNPGRDGMNMNGGAPNGGANNGVPPGPNPNDMGNNPDENTVVNAPGGYDDATVDVPNAAPQGAPAPSSPQGRNPSEGPVAPSYGQQPMHPPNGQASPNVHHRQHPPPHPQQQNQPQRMMMPPPPSEIPMNHNHAHSPPHGQNQHQHPHAIQHAHHQHQGPPPPPHHGHGQHHHNPYYPPHQQHPPPPHHHHYGYGHPMPIEHQHHQDPMGHHQHNQHFYMGGMPGGPPGHHGPPGQHKQGPGGGPPPHTPQKAGTNPQDPYHPSHMPPHGHPQQMHPHPGGHHMVQPPPHHGGHPHVPPHHQHPQQHQHQHPGKAETTEKKRKRPADMPRRPLSAYNFFFSEERVRVLAEIPDPGKSQEEIDALKAAGLDPAESESADKAKQAEGGDAADKKSSATAERLLQIRDAKTVKRRPHRKSHGKIAFKDLAKTIGKRWRALTEHGKIRYTQLAEKDLQRYNEQMKEYNTKRNRFSYQTTPGPLPPQLNAAVMNAANGAHMNMNVVGVGANAQMPVMGQSPMPMQMVQQGAHLPPPQGSVPIQTTAHAPTPGVDGNGNHLQGPSGDQGNVHAQQGKPPQDKPEMGGSDAMGMAHSNAAAQAVIQMQPAGSNTTDMLSKPGENDGMAMPQMGPVGNEGAGMIAGAKDPDECQV